MKKSTLGILAVTVIVVGGGGGCILKQNSQTPPALQQERAAAPSVVAEVAPPPTTPDPSAREGSTPSVSEVVVTKTMDKAGSVTPTTTPAPTPADGSTTHTTEKTVGPANVFPSSGQVFAAADALSPITFKWTPLVPKPQEPVTYRLKVWQLMQGQNGTLAMRTNKPIVSKDFENMSEATVSGVYTGPCKPPYLCDFVWGVEAISGGVSSGMNSTTAFSVAGETVTTQSDSSAVDGTR